MTTRTRPATALLRVSALFPALALVQGCSWFSFGDDCSYLEHHGVARVVAISQTHADFRFQPGNRRHTIARDEYPHFSFQPGSRYTAVLSASDQESCEQRMELKAALSN